jgi:TusA-related sulfurtransferase
MTRIDSDEAVGPIEILDGSGESCATLTPVVAARMRELGPGEQLEIVSDDPTAPEALAAWARLTGNALVEAREDGELQRVVLRRRQ